MRSFQKNKLLILVLLIFIFLLFWSCKKNERLEENSSSDTTVESETSNKSTLVFGEGRDKVSLEDNTSSQDKGFSEIEKGDIKGQLFSIESSAVIPEDMVIGPLLKYNSTVKGSFPFAIISFFTDLGKGKLNKDILHPFWSENIQKLYGNNLSEEYYTIRIGDMVTKNGISITNIRLIGKTGRASGSVSADNFESQWLLSDISIDITQLEDIYLREDLEFNPLSYSNILLNY